MNGYLLDTNALSEATKNSPDSGFMAWFKDVDELQLYTSCLVLGEIKKGILLQGDGKRRKQYEGWFKRTTDAFEGKIVNVDKAVGDLWGELLAHGQQNGKTPPAIDALIVAQCLHNQLVLVTRNRRDFEHVPGLDIHCPWSESV